MAKLPPGSRTPDVAAHADAALTAYHAVKEAAHLLYPRTTAVVIGAGARTHRYRALKARTPVSAEALWHTPLPL